MENMALRVTKQYWWRSMRNVEVMGGKRSFGFSTTPKMKQFASSTVDAAHAHHNQTNSSRWQLKAEYAPVYVVFGMVAVAVGIGIHTAKQNLFHGPAVQVNKRRRGEVLPEVDHPDDVVSYADKFINKSFLRKVGHIQEKDPAHTPSPRPADPFTRSRDVESLKSVGALEPPKKKTI